MHYGYGMAHVHYHLDLGARQDHSLITWYRATKRDGSDAIPVAVSRHNHPMDHYTLTQDDMGYYLVAGIYGWAVWLRRGDDGKILPITHTPRRKIASLATVGVIAWAVILFVLLRYTDSTVPYGDSFTTAASIVALYMLARKYAEQWLVWIVVDVVCCWLYVSKGLYPTAALYGLYALLAVFGYRKWLKMMNENDSKDETTQIA